MPTLFGLNPFSGFSIIPENGLLFHKRTQSTPNMPVQTRSNITGPTRTMTGVKRKFIEILDSDDESYTDYDSEQDLEDEYKLKYDAVMQSLVREQNRVEELEEELNNAIKRIDRLKENILEYQSSSLVEFMCFAGLVTGAFVMGITSVYLCNNHDYNLLTI
jgi:hypothetical protein